MGLRARTLGEAVQHSDVAASFQLQRLAIRREQGRLIEPMGALPPDVFWLLSTGLLTEAARTATACGMTRLSSLAAALATDPTSPTP